MRYLNTRISMLISGALTTLGGILNLSDVEKTAVDSWGNLSGRELDIASALEQVCGFHFAGFGVSILLIALLTNGISRARSGAVVIGLTLVSQLLTFSTLSSKGYLEEGLPIVLYVFLAIGLIAFIACVKSWNEATK